MAMKRIERALDRAIDSGSSIRLASMAALFIGTLFGAIASFALVVALWDYGWVLIPLLLWLGWWWVWLYGREAQG